MKEIPSYLRLIPRPLAKCIPAVYPRPRTDGVELRRIGIGQRRWLFIHTLNGRQFETVLTGDELLDLVEQGRALLERDREDI